MNKEFMYDKNELNNYKYVNDMSNAEVNITCYDNAIILPIKSGKGGVCNQYGKFLNSSVSESDWKSWGGEYKYKEENIHKSEESVMFLGYHINHWGHFLIEETARFWAIGKVKKCKYVILDTSGVGIQKNFLEFLDLLGLKEADLIDVKEITRFNKVYIPTQCISKKKGYTKEFKSIFDKVVNNVELSSYNIPKKIYLSRQLFVDAKQKEFGEIDIEKLFREAGYTVVYPELLSVSHQIAIFQKAEKIACVNGTIPLMILFGNSNLDITVFNKTSLLHDNLVQASNVTNIEPIYVDSYYEPIKNHPRYLGEGPFWILINDNVVNYFQKYEHIKIKKQKKIISYYLKYYWLYFKIRILRNSYLWARHKIGLMVKNEKK